MCYIYYLRDALGRVVSMRFYDRIGIYYKQVFNYIYAYYPNGNIKYYYRYLNRNTTYNKLFKEQGQSFTYTANNLIDKLLFYISSDGVFFASMEKILLQSCSTYCAFSTNSCYVYDLSVAENTIYPNHTNMQCAIQMDATHNIDIYIYTVNGQLKYSK